MAFDSDNSAIPQAQNDAREHVTNELPYKWGRIQSWLLIVCGALGFLLWTGLLFVDSFKAFRIVVYENMAASIVCVPAGFGLLRKKMFGLVLFDVYLVYWCVRVLAKYLRFEYNTPQMVFSLAITGLMAAYTNKRVREFH